MKNLIMVFILSMGIMATAEAAPAAEENKEETIAVISKVDGNFEFKELLVGVDATGNRPGRSWVTIPAELEDKDLWFSSRPYG